MSFSCGGGKEGPVLKKLSVCILFGGVSSEHEVSLRSAESVLNHIDKDKYNIFPVGITKDGDWILFGGKDYGMLPAGTWQNCEENRRAAISPVRGQGLLSFENDCVVRERIDVVFPVMHGENCEDGAIQGLLQIAGIPYVGPHVAASAACMDKTITKLIASQAGVRQADWQLVTREGFARSRAAVLDAVEAKFPYPVFVKPAGTGSSVGVAKAQGREALEAAIEAALKDEGFTHCVRAGYDFAKAIATARSLAAPGGNVLLSPACASFDLYKNFMERGQIFKACVAALEDTEK